MKSLQSILQDSQKEFDEKFPKCLKSGECAKFGGRFLITQNSKLTLNGNEARKIKSFLHTHHKKVLEGVVEMTKEMEKDLDKPDENNEYPFGKTQKKIGYNQALQDLQGKLREIL